MQEKEVNEERKKKLGHLGRKRESMTEKKATDKNVGRKKEKKKEKKRKKTPWAFRKKNGKYDR